MSEHGQGGGRRRRTPVRRVPPVLYVEQRLYSEASGEPVVAKLLDDRVLVSVFHPADVQDRAIEAATRLAASARR
jgi:hypothetical protein